MTHSGYVYVLANPSTNGIVKIGKTQQSPNARARALSSASGVPTPFVVVYQAYFDDCQKAERFVHSRLENFRVSNNREFFQVKIHVAVDTIIEAKNHPGSCEDVLTSTKDENEEINDSGSLEFRNIPEPARELYELLDILMNHSMRGWTGYAKNIGLSMPQFTFSCNCITMGSTAFQKLVTISVYLLQPRVNSWISLCTVI